MDRHRTKTNAVYRAITRMWLDTRTAGPSVVPSSVLLRSGSSVVVIRSVVVLTGKAGRFLNGRFVVDGELSLVDKVAVVAVVVVVGVVIVVSDGIALDVASVVAKVVAVVALDLTVDFVVVVVVVVVVGVVVVVVDLVVAVVAELVNSFPPLS